MQSKYVISFNVSKVKSLSCFLKLSSISICNFLWISVFAASSKDVKLNNVDDVSNPARKNTVACAVKSSCDSAVIYLKLWLMQLPIDFIFLLFELERLSNPLICFISFSSSASLFAICPFSFNSINNCMKSFLVWPVFCRISITSFTTFRKKFVAFLSISAKRSLIATCLQKTLYILLYKS